MGNLPSARTNPSFAFEVVGVDFAGPFLTRDRKGRGCKIIKSYLCIFVCFTTKALHLEIASDLSAEAFIMCLNRFISRRGKPSEIHCDNGRNFVGANNEFKRFLESCSESISSYAAEEFIKFKFSPAYSPHFNGLSEAGVKAAKHHLIRMVGNTHLTFEELATLFSQIEAILNSRPLTPLSSDPTDLYPLCPGHFLIGKPLTSLPSPVLIDTNPRYLARYELIDQIRQQFWERWRTEFLNELQQRSKWRISQGQISEGDMVVLKEPNLPPLKWRMGRIHRLYPGTDGVARVADVNTSKGVIRRAVTNLCPLPNEQ
ncbi:unnamed protein product [Parnassius mnemosyne]|uniref:Integrase catalytic domain-containing protein n=1 Tax=Parnassius mnemosyne TaxID=213953 RepID=A0AAV1M5F4_9NEOP